MHNLEQEIQHIQQDFLAALNKASDEQALEHIRIKFLGRNGIIALLMEKLKTLSIDEKRIIGPLINNAKSLMQEKFEAQKLALKEKLNIDQHRKLQSFDVTAYIPNTLSGSLHPLTHLKQQIEDIFITMGYEIMDGPEVDTEYYNFEALNIPAGHPARDMWDTFWLDIPSLLLRTHTSSVQVHAMEMKELPLAIVVPGRCYRHEATDASHDFLFMQLEGLFISKNVSLGNLLATVKTFLEALFGHKNLAIRVRPSYFPFVEPGIEIDIECPFCTQGCSTCKYSRWIEASGAGLVHPHVLRACNIDPHAYSGFAFGFGLTRLAMLKYSINDIRLLHSNMHGFLEQF
jgi:phenylalanyl-tRNA synthetase alpha chain